MVSKENVNKKQNSLRLIYCNYFIIQTKEEVCKIIQIFKQVNIDNSLRKDITIYNFKTLTLKILVVRNTLYIFWG